MTPGLLLVIPAYRAATTLPKLLPEALAVARRVIVVDDGSPDDLLGAVQGFELVDLLRHPRNLGKGAALRTGLTFALTLPDWRWIGFLDADGQHAPALMAEMVAAGEREGAGMVAANRMGAVGKMPWSRRFSNGVSSRLVGLRCGQRTPDVQCGMRLLRRDLAERLHWRNDRYGVEVEMLIAASDLGARIVWHPIPAIYAGQVSSIRHVRDTWDFARIYFASWFRGKPKA